MRNENVMPVGKNCGAHDRADKCGVHMRSTIAKCEVKYNKVIQIEKGSLAREGYHKIENRQA